MNKGGAQREKLVSSDGRVDSQPSKASGKHHQSLLLEHALCFRYFVKVFLTPTTVIQSRNPEAVLYRANGKIMEKQNYGKTQDPESVSSENEPWVPISSPASRRHLSMLISVLTFQQRLWLSRLSRAAHMPPARLVLATSVDLRFRESRLLIGKRKMAGMGSEPGLASF